MFGRKHHAVASGAAAPSDVEAWKRESAEREMRFALQAAALALVAAGRRSDVAMKEAETIVLWSARQGAAMVDWVAEAASDD